MTNLKIISLVAAVIGLVASSSQAHKIEVCVIPLSDIVIPEAKGLVGTLQHMFPRGTKGTNVTGLNYEPVDTRRGWANNDAKIRVQDYPNAVCAELLNVEDETLYDQAWNAISTAMNEYAATNRYKILGSNCQDATSKVLTELGHEIPAEITQILEEQETFGMNMAQLNELANSQLGQIFQNAAANPNGCAQQ